MNYVLSFGLIRNFVPGSCFNGYESQVVTDVEDLLNRYEGDMPLWQANVLRAYMRLDSEVADYFKQALTSNLQLLRHVLLLAKRLVDRGDHDAAISVVRATLDIVKNIPTEEQSRYEFRVREAMAHSALISEFQDAMQKASDLESALRTILLELNSGKKLEFFEAQFR